MTKRLAASPSGNTIARPPTDPRKRRKALTSSVRPGCGVTASSSFVLVSSCGGPTSSCARGTQGGSSSFSSSERHASAPVRDSSARSRC
eukprot:7211013-Alexandrium_andersonii.AAC.1